MTPDDICCDKCPEPARWEKETRAGSEFFCDPHARQEPDFTTAPSWCVMDLTWTKLRGGN